MNRLLKYKESLIRFIKDKNTNANFVNIANVIDNSDLVFPIILLTTMNNQNKRYHISMQGYYVAGTIEFLYSLMFLYENNKSLNISQYNDLIALSNKNLLLNIESIKNVFDPVKFNNIIRISLEYYNEYIKDLSNLFNYSPTFDNTKHYEDIIEWYLVDNKELIDKYRNKKMLAKESLEQYIYYKYTRLSELAVLLGWIMGGGDISNLSKLKKTAKYFSILYKLSLDFDNLEKDINNNSDFTYNYILNCGLQNSYESFLIYKEKFIEESMIQDIYTNTFKELLDDIEYKIDIIINKSSPDLKSTYSTPTTSKR